MKSTKRQIRSIIQVLLEAWAGVRDPLTGMGGPSSVDEWTKWGRTFDLSPEYDNDGQLIFYLSHNQPDRAAIAAEALKAGANVDTDNDGNDMIYTGMTEMGPMSENFEAARRVRFKRIIRETLEFAPTAQEEAEKINAQTGAGYVTDQAFWEKQGIVTGKDLAIDILNSTYSDFYKEVHGFRPRHGSFTSVEEAQSAIDDLDRYYMGMMEQETLEIERQEKIEREREELEALMPGEFDFQELPKQAGMGRRMEARMRTTESKLRKIIREALLSEAGDDLSNAELAKELKGGASDIAAAVPAKMNDELARIIQTLTAMAQYDKSKFEKMVGYADSLGANALEKAQKGEKPGAEGEEK